MKKRNVMLGLVVALLVLVFTHTSWCVPYRSPMDAPVVSASDDRDLGLPSKYVFPELGASQDSELELQSKYIFPEPEALNNANVEEPTEENDEHDAPDELEFLDMPMADRISMMQICVETIQDITVFLDESTLIACDMADEIADCESRVEHVASKVINRTNMVQKASSRMEKAIVNALAMLEQLASRLEDMQKPRATWTKYDFATVSSKANLIQVRFENLSGQLDRLMERIEWMHESNEQAGDEDEIDTISHHLYSHVEKMQKQVELALEQVEWLKKVTVLLVHTGW